MMQTEQTRRQAFVEQVRKVLGPKLGDLSQKQKDLLDRGLTEIFAENRPVTDAELEGQLELVELAAPRELEAAYKVFSQDLQSAS
jgi:CRISPR/Cas system endoribonuclease Cas6 (RAMP superfamily)